MKIVVYTYNTNTIGVQNNFFFKYIYIGKKISDKLIQILMINNNEIINLYQGLIIMSRKKHCSFVKHKKKNI